MTSDIGWILSCIYASIVIGLKAALLISVKASVMSLNKERNKDIYYLGYTSLFLESRNDNQINTHMLPTV